MKWEGETPSGWTGFWRRRALLREARRLMLSLFDDPQNLTGTSLRPKHRGRVDLHGVEVSGDTLVSLTFTILRHPRPYPFSHQYHKVVESYRYTLPDGPLERGRSLNLSRLEGRDGEPPGSSI